MDSVLALHRFHFAFTITFHYLFAQLTMGLALLIFVLKSTALKTGDDRYNNAARFWIKLFAITFAVGVVTGIPMEFQFGTNWSRFSRFRAASSDRPWPWKASSPSFLESSFLGLLIYGENRLSRKLHWLTSLILFAGTWLSGFFIVATDAWMQHPVAYAPGRDGVALSSFWGLILNPWTSGCTSTTCSARWSRRLFVMASAGAFYLLSRKQEEYGRHLRAHRRHRRRIASVLMLFPTGDRQGVHGHALPAGHPGRHGGTVREHLRRPHRHPRPAGYGEAEARQSAPGAARVELPHLPAVGRGGQRS